MKKRSVLLIFVISFLCALPVLLANQGKITMESGKNQPGSTMLDAYIHNNYKFSEKIGKYSVYFER